MRKIIVGSRKSNLALTQTNWVIDQLKKAGVEHEFAVEKIVTKGDKILDVTLSKVGGKGLFVKEIEQAMYDKKIDFAVHSMKDMPAELPEGLIIAAIPKREDPRDVLISKDGTTFDELPEGAVIGTSSLRRSAQLLAKRPDLQMKWIRGNIETRIRKLHEEDYDAIILAAAGLKRAGLSEKYVTEYLEPELVVPAVGQGALAIECREDDEEIRTVLEKIHDNLTAKVVTAERTFLNLLNGGCQIPIGGYAYLENEEIILTALVGSTDGKTILKEVIRGTDPVQVGKEAAEKLLRQGAKEIIEAAKEELDN